MYKPNTEYNSKFFNIVSDPLKEVIVFVALDSSNTIYEISFAKSKNGLSLHYYISMVLKLMMIHVNFIAGTTKLF